MCLHVIDVCVYNFFLWFICLRLKTREAVKLAVGTLPVFDEASGLWMCAAGESCSYGGSKNFIIVVRHHRVHSGERPYVCRCGLAYSQRGHLEVHIRASGGERTPLGVDDPHKRVDKFDEPANPR